MLIQATNLSKSYDDSGAKLQILKDLSFTLNPGEIISIVGSSGSGKTTLLSILSTLDQPDSGEVEFDGKKIDYQNPKQIDEIRSSEIGIVFQSFELISSLTASENIKLAAANKADLDSRVSELLNELGIPNKGNNYPGELSGGEQQRVAIARSLINDPKVIFADEPTGNLDSVTGRKVIEMFIELARKKNKSVIIVTHDLELSKLTDRTLRLSKGVFE